MRPNEPPCCKLWFRRATAQRWRSSGIRPPNRSTNTAEPAAPTGLPPGPRRRLARGTTSAECARARRRGRRRNPITGRIGPKRPDHGVRGPHPDHGLPAPKRDHGVEAPVRSRRRRAEPDHGEMTREVWRAVGSCEPVGVRLCSGTRASPAQRSSPESMRAGAAGCFRRLEPAGPGLRPPWGTLPVPPCAPSPS